MRITLLRTAIATAFLITVCTAAVPTPDPSKDKAAFEQAAAGEWREVFSDPGSGDWKETSQRPGEIIRPPNVESVKTEPAPRPRLSKKMAEEWGQRNDWK